jgi:anti-sigma regulatory factor (Ser/Thr protein kinase)/biotin operon repressor
MSLTKQTRDEIKQFILWNVRNHSKDIVRYTLDKYKLSRTTILKYISELSKENQIEIDGSTRDRLYSLRPSISFMQTYQIQEQLAEDKAWRNDISHLFNGSKENVTSICHYGFTEIFNNAIDHSEGTEIAVEITFWIDQIIICINDNGVGIFNKIQKKYDLDDSLHAILELSKGKLTTNPESHTGEGIFFTSRMFEFFAIYSGKYRFGSKGIDIFMEVERDVVGTQVYMEISTNSGSTTESVFSQFTGDSDDYGFSKTIVPVNLARYGNENLISRSQAKRLMARLDKFKTVILDFNNVENIGRAFADEIFRVYVKNHPNIRVLTKNDNKAIKKMVLEILRSNGQ